MISLKFYINHYFLVYYFYGRTRRAWEVRSEKAADSGLFKSYEERCGRICAASNKMTPPAGLGGGGGIPRNNIVLYYSAVLGRLRKIHGTEGLMGHKDKYRWVRFTYSGNRFGLAPYARFASPSAILFQLFISCFAANLSFRNGVKKKWEREFRARTFFKIFQMYVIVRTVKKKNTSIKMTKKKNSTSRSNCCNVFYFSHFVAAPQTLTQKVGINGMKDFLG